MGQGMSGGTGSAGAVETKHHFYHDMEGDASLSTTVVSAIAEVRGVDVASLGFALHDYVDTDALDAIFAPKLDGTRRADSRMELSLMQHTVTIDGDGHIVVTGEQGPRTL